MQRLNHARLIEDGHRHAVQIRKDYKMRTFITAMAIALLAAVAPAQAIAKGKRQQQDAPKAEDQAKKKATEEAYKNALKSIPVSNEKPDPWKTMR